MTDPLSLSKSKKPLKENDLFPPLKEFFESQGYQVYAEVPCYGRTADIIAVKNSIHVVVEMKTALTLKLVEQVFNWRGMANLVFAAVPNRTEITLFARQLLESFGIGLLVLDIDNFSEDPLV